MATVASAGPDALGEVMAQFKVSVRPYTSHRRPHLKWVVNAYHPSKGRSRSFFSTKPEAESEATLLPIN